MFKSSHSDQHLAEFQILAGTDCGTVSSGHRPKSRVTPPLKREQHSRYEDNGLTPPVGGAFRLPARAVAYFGFVVRRGFVALASLDNPRSTKARIASDTVGIGVCLPRQRSIASSML